jgi:hypothetical protein
MAAKHNKLTIKMLKKALVRAFENHGHKYNCSAARGMECDCTCGWLEIREIVQRIQSANGAEHG